MRIYKRIEPIKRSATEDALDELRIKVEYDKGGYYGRRGIWAYFIPVMREEKFGYISETCTLYGDTREAGFKICLAELARKSQKVEDELAAKVEAVSDRIAELWNECNWHEIKRILDNIKK